VYDSNDMGGYGSDGWKEIRRQAFDMDMNLCIVYSSVFLCLFFE
jgi:hypothetical protein